MQSFAAPYPWTQAAPAVRRCERCRRTEHVIEGDGATVCRVCLFAWGHYSRMILRGMAVREAGGIQLRHAAHAYPILGCPLCRADQLRGAPSFDGWLRGRNA
jgi:hypothetical protein